VPYVELVRFELITVGIRFKRIQVELKFETITDVKDFTLGAQKPPFTELELQYPFLSLAQFNRIK
jgi:hypothetical protein